VERGDLVLEELPFARGPKRDSGIACLGCYQFLQFGEDGDSLDRCELCDWPLCGSCADDDDASDHRGECQVFSAARVTFAGNVSDDGVCPQLDCITPLRLVRRGSSGGNIHNSAGSGGPGTPGGTCQNISFGSRGPFLGDRMRAGKYRKLIATTSKKAVDQKHRVGHGGANDMNRVSSVYNAYIMILPRIKMLPIILKYLFKKGYYYNKLILKR